MNWPILSVALLLGGIAFAAPRDPDCKEGKPGLAAKATVSCAQARKAAFARVPDSEVRSAELEEEGGRLVYSFDLAVSGREGVEEVQVDAASGDVVSVKHEDTQAETAEKKAEQAK